MQQPPYGPGDSGTYGGRTVALLMIPYRTAVSIVKTYLTARKGRGTFVGTFSCGSPSEKRCRPGGRPPFLSWETAMTRKASTNGTPAGTRRVSARVDDSNNPHGRVAVASPHRPEASTAYSGNPLLSLVTREDGWLRIVPARDTEQVYIKWKFSRGPWSRHYVMTVVQYWQMGYGLSLLVDKLDAVDEGSFKPTLDTPYSD